MRIICVQRLRKNSDIENIFSHFETLSQSRAYHNKKIMGNSIESLERKLANMEILVSELIARLAETDNVCEDTIGELKDCSEWIKRSPSTIYKLTSLRKIPHFKNGKRLLFKKSEVYAWLEKYRQYTEEEYKSDVDDNLQQHAKSPWRG